MLAYTLLHKGYVHGIFLRIASSSLERRLLLGLVGTTGIFVLDDTRFFGNSTGDTGLKPTFLPPSPNPRILSMKVGHKVADVSGDSGGVDCTSCIPCIVMVSRVDRRRMCGGVLLSVRFFVLF